MRMKVGDVTAEASIEAVDAIPDGHTFVVEGEPGDVFNASLVLRFESPIKEIRMPMRATSKLISEGGFRYDCEMTKASFTVHVLGKQE